MTGARTMPNAMVSVSTVLHLHEGLYCIGTTALLCCLVHFGGQRGVVIPCYPTVVSTRGSVTGSSPAVVTEWAGSGDSHAGVGG